MPFFIDRATLTIIFADSNAAKPSNCDVVDGDTAKECLDYLTPGRVLTEVQATALREGMPSMFLASTDPSERVDRARLAESAARSPALPAAGKWEYKVIPLTEFLGFGTAKGTSSRMESALNEMAADGWELVTTSERDSRWMGGETVLLTVRRYVITEHRFAERFRIEERLRRQVIAQLDAKPS